MVHDPAPRGTTEPWWLPYGQLLNSLPEPDRSAREAALARQKSLTKPPGAMGRLEEIAVWLAGWQGRERPVVNRAQMVVFAGNHGVTKQGVSPYPPSVTAQMVANFEAGGAAICQLCEVYGARLDAVALDLDCPTQDFTKAPAMTAEECDAALTRGAKTVRVDTDILMVGEMGIGNTTSAAALACALLGGAPEDWTGPGTGLDASRISHKAGVVAAGVALHKGHCADPFEALRRLGGREFAAIAGAVLEARRHRVPVLLDGYACSTAVLVLERARKGALDHCMLGHLSSEPGHQRLLGALNKTPILDLGMRLGEGTGAAMALAVLQGAVAAHNGMATFAEAAVEGRS